MVRSPIREESEIPSGLDGVGVVERGVRASSEPTRRLVDDFLERPSFQDMVLMILQKAGIASRKKGERGSGKPSFGLDCSRWGD